jgi:broad specificity phosphatase PhoE
MVTQEPDLPAPQWSLSELGLQQAVQLATLPIWVEVSMLYSSTEMKAIQAAEVISKFQPQLKRRSLFGLNEAQRPLEFLSAEEYQRCAYNFFAYPDKIAAPGWERSSAVRNLVVGTYQDIVHELQRNQQSAAIISHGMALSLLRGYILKRPATYEEWRKVPFASYAKVDLASGKLVQDFQTVEALETR